MISSEVIAELVILILLIALSAWFSSAETAYSTVSEVSLRARADEKDRRAARAPHARAHPCFAVPLALFPPWGADGA